VVSRRLFSIQISQEVKDALRSHIPVVSLESTIITHGLPYPQNIEMALKVEDEIRRHGCVPATTAFIKGIPKVGLTSDELKELAQDVNVKKVSRRDIPFIMAKGLNGGTTISGTMILSQKAGIKVFATGGLGGVHRDGENTMDISADLDELSKTSVAVVCAGPKSILDIERTMEYLETKGVFVGTFGPDGTNIPGFYTRDSGVKSVYNFQSFEEAAEIISKGSSMDLNNGYLFCIPPPAEIALDSDFINSVIEDANEEAKQKGIKGKDITPFLLSRIATKTKGASVKTNIEFVLNNARSASKISVALNKLSEPSQLKPPIEEKKIATIETRTEHNVDSIVIGSVAIDSYVKMNEVIQRDSNPAKISTSFGGVGYNVALESVKAGNNSLKFVSVVGNDLFGDKIIEEVSLNKSMLRNSTESTSQYISFHDAKGELIIAGADMGIIENLSLEHIKTEIEKSKPLFVLTDLNISSKLVGQLSDLSTTLDFKLIIEPTSLPKSKKLSSIKSSIYLSTPTVAELNSIYSSFEEGNKFELDTWFPVIDKLGVDGDFRNKLEVALSKKPGHGHLISEGVFQRGISLLPYISNLVIKDGANGVYFLSASSDIAKVELNRKANFSFKSKGSDGYGVLFEHYEAELLEGDVRNVTGAGDTLAGVLLAELVASPSVLDRDRAVIARAQRAAAARILS
jgi:pseudouridine-5'-phosphate glycosidase/pseudouridine kinase